MTNSRVDADAQQPGLRPLPVPIDLLPNADDAGYCADGVCRITPPNDSARNGE